MLVDIASIERLRESVLLDGDDGPCQSSGLVRLSASCHIARAMGAEGLDGLSRQLTDITQRNWDLLTIVMKLRWMQERRDDGALDPMGWMLFAANDVNSFLMNTRSLFDHVAKVIRLESAGQTPQSFHDLRKWVASDTRDTSHMLDPRLVDLVAECDWFDDLRTVRDDILHRSANTTVLPALPYIGVQITKGITDRLLTEEELLDTENSNIVRFEWFAVASLGRIHLLLEELSHAVRELRAIPDRGDGARSRHGGLAVVHEWCGGFLDVLQPKE